MKLFHYEIRLVNKRDNSRNRIKGIVMVKSIMGAMSKLNEYYDDNTIVVVNLNEENDIVYELPYEEF